VPSLIYIRNKPKRKAETAKQKADRLAAAEAGKALKDKWANIPKFSDKNRTKVQTIKVVAGPPVLTAPPGRGNTKHLPSVVTPGGEAVVKPKPTYTGTAMKGVATMHKSNMVPVFDDQHMVDIANMRRNEYTKDPKKQAKDDASSNDPLPW
jgi:hypothetical protein